MHILKSCPLRIIEIHEWFVKLFILNLTKSIKPSDNLIIIAGGVPQITTTTSGVFMFNLKSGANQGAAGASANELWIDTADNSIKIGV